MTRYRPNDWYRRKREGSVAKQILRPYPPGTQMRLGIEAGSAYKGLYRKNDDGTWDQIQAPPPLIWNISAEHLGFVAGSRAIRKAIAG